MNKKDLKPASVFRYFDEINHIPRPSKHEEKMVEFLKGFGQSRGLETIVDKVGNVLIKKPATQGMEDKPQVTLQSHIDMVCDKLAGHEIDFLNDPIESYIISDEEAAALAENEAEKDGGWLKARGTTLGADDGIGCAMELAILDADDIPHGPLECLFTVDEETGLTGANNLEAKMLSSKILINLDSEDEGVFFVSCAGGKTTTATFEYTKREAPDGYFFIKSTIKGLTGGHSGDDINKKRANAAKILARFLYMEQKKMPLLLAQFNSGKLHNAIPRDGSIVFAVPFKEKETVRVDWNVFCSGVEEEFCIEHRVGDGVNAGGTCNTTVCRHSHNAGTAGGTPRSVQRSAGHLAGRNNRDIKQLCGSADGRREAHHSDQPAQQRDEQPYKHGRYRNRRL